MAGSDPTYGVNMAKKIEHWSTDRLIPYENNSRTHSSEQVGQIAQSIVEFGFLNPILVDTNDGIIAGHGRLEAAKELKLEEVPVVVLDHLSEKQRKAYIIVDNKLALNAGWDENALATEIAELNELDFDIELLGFTEEELEGFMPEELETEEYGDAESIPDIPEEAETKEGDLYILGNHRLLCGDSTNIQHVERLMDGAKVNMVFTDPPYGMGLDTDYTKMPVSPNGATPLKHNKGLVDDFNPEMINVIMSLECDETFIFGADYFAEYLPEKNKGSWIVWDKRVTENFDRMIGSSFELCWSKSKHKREIARFNNTLFSGESDAKNKVHPTQKPVKLIEWFINKYSDLNHKIVDLYGGSGSTLIAAERTNRHAYLMELDPKYCDVIVKRWEDFTGKKAKLQSTN